MADTDTTKGNGTTAPAAESSANSNIDPALLVQYVLVR